MESLVGGCNFLLKAIRHEAFTYQNGALNFVTNTGKQLCLYNNEKPASGSGLFIVRIIGMTGERERHTSC